MRWGSLGTTVVARQKREVKEGVERAYVRSLVSVTRMTFLQPSSLSLSLLNHRLLLLLSALSLVGLV